jgi:hypothetical protein
MRLNRAEHARLAQIVERGEPPAMSLLPLLEQRQLTEDERERLRGIVADELVERGLDDEDEPNTYGLELERLIDALGHH